MQTTVVDPYDGFNAVSADHTRDDLDYLAARLHGRRSIMAESERLDSLCRIRNLSEFFRTVFPGSEFQGVLDFQRQLINELVTELHGFRVYLAGPGVNFLSRTLVRFQLENLKVLIRKCLTKMPFEEVKEHLIPLPKEFALISREWTKAESPEDLVRLTPKGRLREKLETALEFYEEFPRAFFFEAALDSYHLQGLVEQTGCLLPGDREIIKPLVRQEADIFNLMLIARGKFYYGLTARTLRPFYIPDTEIPPMVFAAMLNDPDLSSSMNRISKRVLDAESFQYGSKEGPIAVDASIPESLAWKRFFRLANLAFRQSHMGLGAIVGYIGLRRVELANLITISEGIRDGMAPETIRGRLIPRTKIEVEHV